jgi:hypothetical protein
VNDEPTAEHCRELSRHSRSRSRYIPAPACLRACVPACIYMTSVRITATVRDSRGSALFFRVCVGLNESAYGRRGRSPLPLRQGQIVPYGWFRLERAILPRACALGVGPSALHLDCSEIPRGVRRYCNPTATVDVSATCNGQPAAERNIRRRAAIRAGGLGIPGGGRTGRARLGGGQLSRLRPQIGEALQRIHAKSWPPVATSSACVATRRTC